MLTNAMILAAGFGKRMLPLTQNSPKPLLKVNGVALLDYHLQRLAQAEFRNVVINASYLAEQLVSHASTWSSNRQASLKHLESTADYQLRVDVLVEQQLLETGGGLANAIQQRPNMIGKAALFIASGDSWTDLSASSLRALADIAEKKLIHDYDAILLTVENPAHNLAGDFKVSGDEVLEFASRPGSAPPSAPPSVWGPASEQGDTSSTRTARAQASDVFTCTYSGMGFFSVSAFKRYEPCDFRFPLREYFEYLIKHQRLGIMPLPGKWFDVGTPERLRHCEAEASADT